MVPDQPAPTDPAQRDRLAAKLVGHYGYYGITGNFMPLQQYFRQVTKIWRKWLERRSRKKELPWAKFLPILARHPLPPAQDHAALHRCQRSSLMRNRMQ